MVFSDRTWYRARKELARLKEMHKLEAEEANQRMAHRAHCKNIAASIAIQLCWRRNDCKAELLLLKFEYVQGSNLDPVVLAMLLAFFQYYYCAE